MANVFTAIGNWVVERTPGKACAERPREHVRVKRQDGRAKGHLRRIVRAVKYATGAPTSMTAVSRMEPNAIAPAAAIAPASHTVSFGQGALSSNSTVPMVSAKQSRAKVKTVNVVS